MSSKSGLASDTDDSDTQLALLASILEPTVLPLAHLTKALKDSRGDVGRAAEALLLSHGDTKGSGPSQSALVDGTRKEGKGVKGDGSIASWLGKRKHSAGHGDGHVSRPSPVQAEPDSPMPASPPTTPPKRTSGKSSRLPVDLMKVLRQPPLQTKTVPRPAVHLASQSAIDAHGVPLSFLSSPLSPALASALYLTMMRESEKWERHQWYLAGRWVESPHLMSGYQRAPKVTPAHDTGHQDADSKETHSPGSESIPLESDANVPGAGSSGTDHTRVHGVHDDDDAQYFYSGAELAKDNTYPHLLSHAADLIEPLVNAHLASRPRYPLEYAGEWRANRCGANRYDGAASGVGWHADQLTYLGPYCTIASLSLGTSRHFRVRETKSTEGVLDPSSNGPTAGLGGSSAESGGKGKEIRTYEVTLGHNSLVLMDPGCQERFKHTIPPQKALDIFRPAFDIDLQPIPIEEQKGYTSRINITFRFYRPDFHPLAGIGPFGSREATPVCKCGIPALLRADQKAKARTNLRNSPRKRQPVKDEPPPIKASRLEPRSPKFEPSLENLPAKAPDIKPMVDGLKPDPDDSKISFVSDLPVLGLKEDPTTALAPRIKPDDMSFFWQCQSPGQTGDLKGCGFFKILDMRAEGRGPCVADTCSAREAPQLALLTQLKELGSLSEVLLTGAGCT